MGFLLFLEEIEGCYREIGELGRNIEYIVRLDSLEGRLESLEGGLKATICESLEARLKANIVIFNHHWRVKG